MTMLAELRPGHWPKVLFFSPSVWQPKQIHMSLRRVHLRFMEKPIQYACREHEGCMELLRASFSLKGSETKVWCTAVELATST